MIAFLLVFILIVKSGDVRPTLSLGRFIRDYANLKGTKLSCRQAGCGVCVVTAKVPDLASGSLKTISVNSVSHYLAVHEFQAHFFALVLGSCFKLQWMGNHNC